MGIEFEFDIEAYDEDTDTWYEYRGSCLTSFNFNMIVNTNFHRKKIYDYVFNPDNCDGTIHTIEKLNEVIETYEKKVHYMHFYNNEFLKSHFQSKMNMVKNYLYIVKCQHSNNNNNPRERIYTLDQLCRICDFYKRHEEEQNYDYDFIEMMEVLLAMNKVYNTRFRFTISQYY